MRKEEPLIVWQNGKKTELKRGSKTKKERDDIKQEPSQTIYDNNVYISPKNASKKKQLFGDKQNVSGSNNQYSYMKPTLIAIISAVIIGSVLGLFMLNIFAGSNQNLHQVPTNLSPALENEDNSSPTPTIIEEMSAYVVQAGVFSEEPNAKEWAKKYDQENHPTMIWERDEQFFLLVGTAQTEEQAKIQATSLETYDYELFVKRWTTSQTELSLTEAESDWLHHFQNQWDNTLASISLGDEFTKSDWDALRDDIPTDSERLSTMENNLDDLLQAEVEGKDISYVQVFLLNIWKQYEKLLD